MVDLVLLQSVSYVAAAIGVCVAAFYYAFTLRETTRNRKIAYTTNFMQQFYSKENSRRFIDLSSMRWTDFDDFMKKYGPETNPEAWNKFQLQLAHWSRQGMLVRDGLLSAGTLWSWWGWVPLAMWEKYEPIILEYRARYEALPKGGLHEDFEDLYYALIVEREKYRKDFIERKVPMRAEKRKALGLKPIPPYT